MDKELCTEHLFLDYAFVASHSCAFEYMAALLFYEFACFYSALSVAMNL